MRQAPFLSLSFTFFFAFSMVSRADVVRLTLKIEFANGSAVVAPGYRAQVERLAEFLKKYPTTKAAIEGHSDNVGADDLNLKLSDKRAQAVRNMLIYDFGIGPVRVDAKGFGKSTPIASNDTAEGRLQNRRVVALVEGDDGVLKNEAKEIDVAKEAAPPPPPVVEEPPPPVLEPASPPVVPTDRYARLLAGPYFESRGPGFSLDWNPILHFEKTVKFEGLAGILLQKGNSGAGYLGFELGYFVAWKPLTELELNAGACLTQLTAGVRGISFSLYLGLAWYHRLFTEDFPWFDRVILAYTPILVKHNNRQVIRLSLGFTLF